MSTALHKVTIAKRNFHPSGLFNAWGNEARKLLTVETEEASTFQAADLAATVADMFIYIIILLTRPIIVLEVLIKTLVFCCIGYIQSKCRPILFKATKQ